MAINNMGNLAQRVITAAVAIPIVLLAIIYGDKWGVGILVLLGTLGAMYEFQAMYLKLHDKQEKKYLILALTAISVIVNIFLAGSIFQTFIISTFVLSLYFLFTACKHENNLKEHLDELIHSIFGFGYFVSFILYILKIREFENGVHYLILFLFIMWSTDTGAYFAGRAFGKRKLYEVISPKKSMEGALGGILAAFVIALIYKLIVDAVTGDTKISWFFVVSGAPIVSAFSQIGDLLESFIKRAVGVKDSGNILPGHGGVMDRLDGMIFSAPVVYFFVVMFC